MRGIVNEDFVDLTQETSHNLELVAGTPSSALGSTRDKPDLAYCQKIFGVLKAHGIGHFFYIGGNDSSDTVRIVSEQARAAGYPLRCIHIPKTILISPQTQPHECDARGWASWRQKRGANGQGLRPGPKRRLKRN